MPPKANGKKKGVIDEAVAKKIQSKLKAVCYGTTPQRVFARYDKDKGGSLDHAEFKKMIRTGLKISKDDLADADLEALITALDDDGGGTLSIDELADFVERGTATFGTSDGVADGGAKWGGVAIAKPGTEPKKAEEEAPPPPLDTDSVRRWQEGLRVKDKQIALVSLQNEQLRASLGQMEAEMQVLSKTLMGKDSDLQKLTRVIKKKDDEIKRLKALEQQDEGRERAVEIASKQNSSLLKILEAQEEITRQLKDENEQLKAEIADSAAFQAKQVKRAAELEMRLRQELADSQHSFMDLQLRYDDLSLRHEGFEERVRNAENDARARVATMHEELLSRRDRQYVLLQRVQDAEDRLQKVKDKEELARTNTSVLGERSEELEVRLESAMTQLRAQDEDMRTRTEKHAAVVDEFALQLGQKERGLSKLQVRTDELSSALMKMVEKHKEASSVTKAREAQAASLKEQVKGGRRQVAELELQAVAAARTLEQTRNRAEALRESEAALKGQVEHLHEERVMRQRKPAPVKGADARQLEAEAKGRTMAARAYLALFGFASKCGYIFAEDGSVASSAGAAVPVSRGPVDFLQHINLSECAMRDADLSAVVDVASRCRQLRSISLSYNFLTDTAVPVLASLLNHPTSRVEFLDVRNNQLSIEGIRALALILEGTVTRGIKHVYIQKDGQIEAIGDAGSGVSMASGDATASTTIVKIDARENFGQWATQAPPALGPQTTQLTKEKYAQRTPAALAKMERASALRKRKQKDTWRNRVLDDVYGVLDSSTGPASEVSRLSYSLAELPDITQPADSRSSSR